MTWMIMALTGPISHPSTPSGAIFSMKIWLSAAALRILSTNLMTAFARAATGSFALLKQ